MTDHNKAELTALREQRADLHRQMRGLYNGAAAEDRDLNHKEARVWDRLDREFRVVDGKIAALDGTPLAGLDLDARDAAMSRSTTANDGQRERFLPEVSPRSAAPGQDEIRTPGDMIGASVRALSTGTGMGQVLTPPEHYPQVLDWLAPESVGLRPGFTVIRTENHDLELPHALTDGAANWTAEGDAITPSDATGETITATPRKLAAITVLSNEVMDDSNPAARDLVGRGLVWAAANKLDLGFFEGSGTPPEIRGLKNVSNIGPSTWAQRARRSRRSSRSRTPSRRWRPRTGTRARWSCTRARGRRA